MPSLVPRLALDDVKSNYCQTSAVSFPRACVSSSGEVVVSSGRAGDHVTLAGAMQLNLACDVLPAVVLGGGGSPLSNTTGGDAIPDNSMQNGLARANDDHFVAKPAPLASGYVWQLFLPTSLPLRPATQSGAPRHHNPVALPVMFSSSKRGGAPSHPLPLYAATQPIALLAPSPM